MLTEVVDGKEVTTSRILARLLGREHSCVLRTINRNLGQRSFKYGNFTMRDYVTGGPGHGYEFLITRRGLDVLASVMRHNVKAKIREAYAGAWGAPAAATLPATAPKALPAPAAATLPAVDDSLTCELAELARELREELRRSRETQRVYSDMYANEKRRRERNGAAMGYWHDLYHDLLWRLLYDTAVPLDERMAAHKAFSERISKKK